MSVPDVIIAPPAGALAEPAVAPLIEPTVPVASPDLAAELLRIQSEEAVRIDRERQAELARRELARFD